MSRQTWYAPRDIYFNRDQVLWLLQNLPSIRTGIWPQQPSGYNIEPENIQKQRRRAAYFETPIQIAAEVERRLESCGWDGLLTMAHYCYEETDEALAKYARCSLEEFSFRVTSVLRHISRHNFRAGRYRRRPYLNKKEPEN